MASTAPQQPQSGPSLDPETFQSLLPQLHKLLELVRASAAPAPAAASGAEAEAPASDGAITKAAIEIRTRLAKMRDEIEKLPGGHLSIEQIREVSARLEVEGEKRRQLLRAVTSLNMPVLDDCVKQVEAAATADGRTGDTPTGSGDVIMN